MTIARLPTFPCTWNRRTLVLLQVELEFPGVEVSIPLKPGGFRESRMQDAGWPEKPAILKRHLVEKVPISDLCDHTACSPARSTTGRLIESVAANGPKGDQRKP